MSQAACASITAPDPRQLPLFPDLVTRTPDHELFRLALELDERWAHEQEVMAALPDDLYDEAMLATGEIVDAIAEVPATTLPGILIKARALSWCFNGHPVGHEGEGVATQLSNAILRELVRMDARSRS